MTQKTLIRAILCCMALAVVEADLGGERQDILALGLKAVNQWIGSNAVGCGWEDGTFMIGE